MRGYFPTTAVVLALVLAFASPAVAQQDPTAPQTAEIAADLGPCFALIAVSGTDGKPVYGAKVTTRVQYGLLGVKKLDLEAYTGVDGKVKIASLPDSLKKPMYIYISKSSMQEIVEFKPSLRCHATFDVILH